MTPGIRVIEDGDSLEIELCGSIVRFHAMWLRDNARDAATRSPSNRQRLITLLDIPADTRIAEAGWSDGAVALRFAPDGKTASFDANWLLAHAYDRPAPAVAGWTGGHIVRWDATLGGQVPVEDRAALCEDASVRRRWLGSVRRYGFARLAGMPVAADSVASVAEPFGYVRETNYGRIFDVRAQVNPNNLAYTSIGLQAHTDNPYRDPVPGLQLLACLQNSVEGGGSILVDGFTVAARLLIELGPDGELIAVRFNNRSAAPFVDIPYDLMADYYAAYRRMAELIEDPALTVRFRLEPGELFIVDNQRVLHARDEFTGGGERWLQGCYADKDGLLSSLAALEEMGTGG